MPETALKRCAVCQNFVHCTAAGYCNCGAYSVRQETTAVPALDYERGEFWVPCLAQRKDESYDEFVERVKRTEEAVKAACNSV